MELVAAIFVVISILAAGFILGYNRDRSYYTTILIVIALIYVLFGFMEGSVHRIVTESLIASVFIIAAIFVGKISHIITGLFLIFHGLFDFLHPRILPGNAVPVWYPEFCLYVDLMLGLSVILLSIKGYLSISEHRSQK